jgi:hypothetical protein
VDFIVFINPEFVVSIFDLENDRTGIHMRTGENYEVKDDIGTVFKMLTGKTYVFG